MKKRTENPRNFVLPFDKAKENTIQKIAKIVRQEGWDYYDLRYAYGRVRKQLDLKPTKRTKNLPRLLSDEEVKKFYREIEKADNLQHELMLKLLFFTGVRNRELVNIRMNDIYPDENKSGT